MLRLLTGGSGLLGQHLTLDCDRPTHTELDITKPIEPKDYDLIIHGAAYTDVEGAETARMKCYDVNVNGTFNLIEAYKNTPFVYISSEYAHNPMNFYSLTKYLAEQLVMTHDNYLIIRTLFKPKPWKYPKAFTDQYTQGGYVTDVAPCIEDEIRRWNGKGKRLIYVGDGKGRKSMYQLAIKTRPDVIPNSIKEMKVPIPGDYK